MQYYSGRVVKPDQTKLGSTKPNRTELKELSERSRASKETISQTSGRKLESERDHPERERLAIEELSELHETPFHAHGFGSFSSPHTETLRDSLPMISIWVEDRDSTKGTKDKKKKKQTLCSWLLIFLWHSEDSPHPLI